MILIFLLSAALAASDSPSFYGDIPEDVQTFSIGAGSTAKHFAIRYKNEWLSSVNDLPGQFEVVTDAPWLGDPAQRVTLTRNSPYASAIAVQRPLRKQYLEQGWTENGYVFVNTPASEKPVKKEVLEFAARAREMSREVTRRYQPAQADQTPAATAGTVEPPTFMQQWLGHVVLVLLALCICGAVVKLLILES